MNRFKLLWYSILALFGIAKITHYREIMADEPEFAVECECGEPLQFEVQELFGIPTISVKPCKYCIDQAVETAKNEVANG